MSRPLHRGVSGGYGGKFSGNSHDFLEDYQIKGKTEKEDIDLNRKNAAEQSFLCTNFPFRYLLTNYLSPKHSLVENGFISDPFSPGNLRSRHKATLFLLRFSLVVIVILALTGSFWWTLSVTSSSRTQIFRGYRRLQEKLVTDLYEIGEISIGSSRFKDLENCYQESENYVPCFNVSENVAKGFSNGEEFGRHCGIGSKQKCLVLLPVNYKIPMRWPAGRDVIWFANVNITAQEVLNSGSFTKRMMMLDEDQVSFQVVSSKFDVEDYSHQIAEIIGLRNVSYFVQAGVRTVLDIECGYGSFGAHLSSNQLLTMCTANYEASGSQVQLTLERGLPAMIASFTSKQLPYPSLSFDMIHCARCHVEWDKKDGMYLLEVDRLLRPGGYFVWTDPVINSQLSARNKVNLKKWNTVRIFAENLCWEMLPQQDETVVWKKTSKRNCNSIRKSGSLSICSKAQDIETPYYRPLQRCIAGTNSRRWFPIEEKRKMPSQAKLSSAQLGVYGLHEDELADDGVLWNSAVRNYWSLLSPVLFSDHPKRPGDEDPSPPYNMLRNVLDMNAHLGGFNAALLELGTSVWVMNVIPTRGPNSLPVIVDRGFIGVLHDWCEPFPTYPRTYDLVHAEGLLSLEFAENPRCQVMDLLVEMDRILRPEGWVIIRDIAPLIEFARSLTTHLKWEARVVEIQSNSNEKLLICQKPFFKRQVAARFILGKGKMNKYLQVNYSYTFVL